MVKGVWVEMVTFTGAEVFLLLVPNINFFPMRGSSFPQAALTTAMALAETAASLAAVVAAALCGKLRHDEVDATALSTTTTLEAAAIVSAMGLHGEVHHDEPVVLVLT